MIFRPLVQSGPCPKDAVPLAGGPLWFTHAEGLIRGETGRIMSVDDIPEVSLVALSRSRAPVAGLDVSRPCVMGILNITPDSFSDGGRHFDPEDALRAAQEMAAQGADILDVGGESTRPGAVTIAPEEEIRRTQPVVDAVARAVDLPISIDTRKAPVAEAALDVGARLVNDVAGFTYDARLAPLCAARGAPVCVMHAQGDPATMQQDPVYDDVVLDVYDFLQARIVELTDLGIPHDRIIVDPGIGFGKTLVHNLTLLRNIAVFHGLGCPVLLGVSRKRFIGVIGDAPNAAERAPGSIAVGLAALAQGVQLLRVHDVKDTVQAIRLFQAARGA